MTVFNHLLFSVTLLELLLLHRLMLLDADTVILEFDDVDFRLCAFFVPFLVFCAANRCDGLRCNIAAVPIVCNQRQSMHVLTDCNSIDQSTQSPDL